MQAFLVCEEELVGRAIRQVMIQQGVECPMSSMISYGQAARRLGAEPADLIVAALPDDPLHCVEALDLLASIPRADRTLVIAIGPAADSKLVIRALRGVVDDYVDIHDVETELAAVLAGWRQKWSLDRPLGRLIAVLSPSGGAGSSTLSASLAVQLAKDLKSVALVDLKLETGDLASLLDLKPVHTLADLCKNVDRLDQVSFQRALASHASGVQLIAAPKTLADVELVSAEGVRRSIGLARAMFPSVMVDLDNSFGDEQMEVLRQADLILMVLRLDFASLRNTTKFLEHLDGLGLQMGRIRLVVNRLGLPSEIPLAKAEEALKSKFFHVIPDDPKTVNRANNSGVPVVLDAPSSKFSKSLAKLAQAIQAPQETAAAGGIRKPDHAPRNWLATLARRDEPTTGANSRTDRASPQGRSRTFAEGKS